MNRWDGTLLASFLRVPQPGEYPIIPGKGSFSTKPIYDINHADLHLAMFEYAKSIGVECHLGVHVQEYFEEEGRVGIIVGGQKVEGDLLIGANATEFTWKVTHKDIVDVEEGWVLPGNIDDALKFIEGWDPPLQEIVKAICSVDTHRGTSVMVYYKLVYRDPLPTWVSKGGHTILASDAAHPHLPTSQQGASQAIEDGVTIAECLELASQNNVSIPEAMKAYELLRYNRTVATMKLGEEVRNRWHKTDVSKLPIEEGWIELREKLSLPHHPWLLDHDAKKHVRDNFRDVAGDIRSGKGDKRKYSPEDLRNLMINLVTC